VVSVDTPQEQNYAVFFTGTNNLVGVTESVKTDYTKEPRIAKGKIGLEGESGKNRVKHDN